MADIADGYGMAETGSNQPASAAVISGKTAQGKPYINQICHAITVGAASPRADGWLMLAHIGAAGFAFMDSVEINEQRFPMRVETQKVLVDSGGAGRFRGAPSVFFECAAVDLPMTFSFVSDGEKNPAQGARGGGGGAPASHFVRTSNGRRQVANWGSVTIAPGEVIEAICGGGGGYGNPRDRDPRHVAEDIIEGYVSREGAAAVYGVVTG